MRDRLDCPAKQESGVSVLREHLTASIVAAGLLAQTAWSADSLAQKIEACAQHRDDASRLQCFDAVAKALRTEPPAKDAVADRHIAEPMRSAPVEKPREKPAAAPPHVSQPVTAHVVSVAKTSGGELRIELDNGQVWQENEHDPSLMLSAGDSVQIKPGALKSSILRSPVGVNAKVRRVR